MRKLLLGSALLLAACSSPLEPHNWEVICVAPDSSVFTFTGLTIRQWNMDNYGTKIYQDDDNPGKLTYQLNNAIACISHIKSPVLRGGSGQPGRRYDGNDAG